MIFVFTVAVVWVAKPSSSKSSQGVVFNDLLLSLLIKIIFARVFAGLFSWHPTLMSLAVSVVLPLCHIRNTLKENILMGLKFSGLAVEVVVR